MRSGVVIWSDAVWLLFAAFSAIRIVSYVPQITRIANDSNGASAISYATWSIWFGANASTALYGAVSLHDRWLTFVSLGCGVCCGIVIILTAYKRLTHRRQRSAAVGQDASAS